MQRSRCDLHKLAARCVVGWYFGAKVVCLEFLGREVGEDVHAEDSAAIDGALLCVEGINLYQSLLECIVFLLLFTCGRVLSECKT